jgi:lactam utilization protein B
MTVTINCDMGESFGIYKLGDDEACMPYVTHANIACGFHASDPKVMWRTAPSQAARPQDRRPSGLRRSRRFRPARDQAEPL